MPPRIYPLSSDEPRRRGKPKLWVATGEFREPRAGEVYLSGAIPEGYIAPQDLDFSYPILKPADHVCPHCGKPR